MIEITLLMRLHWNGGFSDKELIEKINHVYESYSDEVTKFDEELQKEAKFLEENNL